jgi:hypothetical protein
LAATFDAGVFEPVAFAAVLAVFSGIALLLFFEDFVAATFLATFTVALARPLVALRLAGAAFFVSWKHSFYAFSVTQPARGTATPLFDVFTGTHRGHKIRMARIGL